MCECYYLFGRSGVGLAGAGGVGPPSFITLCTQGSEPCKKNHNFWKGLSRYSGRASLTPVSSGLLAAIMLFVLVGW